MKWALCALILGIVGCTRTPASIRRLEGDLPATAARDLGCSPDDVTIESIEGMQKRLIEAAGGPQHAYARGCGKRMAYAHMCRGDVSNRTDCDWYAVKKVRLDPLLQRVSFEAKCPQAQIQTTQVAPNTVGVDACGNRLTYLWNCPHNQDFFSPACTWVLNSSSKPQQNGGGIAPSL